MLGYDPFDDVVLLADSGMTAILRVYEFGSEESDVEEVPFGLVAADARRDDLFLKTSLLRLKGLVVP